MLILHHISNKEGGAAHKMLEPGCRDRLSTSYSCLRTLSYSRPRHKSKSQIFLMNIKFNDEKY